MEAITDACMDTKPSISSVSPQPEIQSEALKDDSLEIHPELGLGDKEGQRGEVTWASLLLPARRQYPATGGYLP